MKKITTRIVCGLLGIIAAGVFLLSACTDEDKKIPPPITDPKPQPDDPKEKFHIYLAFGQSNMVGYLGPPVGSGGSSSSQDWVADNGFDTPPDNFVVMAAANDSKNPYGRKMGEWDSAVPPLVRAGNGLSPADFFGRTVAEAVADRDIKVGVIAVAVDGCAINLFSKDIEEFKAYIRARIEYSGYMQNQASAYVDPNITITSANFTTEDYPYKRLVDLAKKAQEEGVIKGIIMHQGESGKVTYNASTGAVGSNGNDSANYAKAVRQIYDDLCEDLGLEPGKIPFLAGQAVGNDNGNIKSIPGAFADLPNTAHIISSDGCLGWNPASTNDDNQKIHFSFDGYKELGTRYGEKMLELLY